MKNILDKFGFIEKKTGRKVPLMVKYKLEPDSITEDDLQVDGDFRMSYFSEEKIPAGITVSGEFELFYAKKLRMIPENLTAKQITLAHLSGLWKIPDTVYPKKDFSVRSCPELISLPEKVHISGFYWASELLELNTFSQDVKAFALEITDCPNLRWTGKEKIGVRNLYLNGDNYFKSLPPGMTMKSIYATYSSLETIPPSPEGGYDTLDLADSKIIKLPLGLKVYSLTISDTEIDSLPENAEIGTLTAFRCPNLDLKNIPSSTRIGKIVTEEQYGDS